MILSISSHQKCFWILCEPPRTSFPLRAAPFVSGLTVCGTDPNAASFHSAAAALQSSGHKQDELSELLLQVHIQFNASLPTLTFSAESLGNSCPETFCLNAAIMYHDYMHEYRCRRKWAPEDIHQRNYLLSEAFLQINCHFKQITMRESSVFHYKVVDPKWRDQKLTEVFTSGQQGGSHNQTHWSKFLGIQTHSSHSWRMWASIEQSYDSATVCVCVCRIFQISSCDCLC